MPKKRTKKALKSVKKLGGMKTLSVQPAMHETYGLACSAGC